LALPNAMTGERHRRSWWLEDALEGESPRPALAGEERADICIVGGGYTGLWTALRIKESDPAADVVVVEGDVCGGGASGRNGGFAMTLGHHFLNLREVCGTEEAVRLARASAEAVREIGRVCSEHGIDADYRLDGWLWVATNDAQRGAWESTIAAIEQAGESPFARLDPEEVRRRSGSAAHLEGVFEGVTATMHPAQLARGLARVAEEKGVRIFERSPMVGLEREAQLAVRTPLGRVRAERVVLALNAWAARLRELRNGFVVMGSDVVATPELPEVLERIGWTDGVAISDSRLMVHYYRTTSSGRVIFGKGGSALAFGGRVGVAGTARRRTWVTERLHRTYPELAAHPIDAYWTGPIDRTVDGLPFFTALGRPDLLCGLGYSGNGVGPSVLGGRILASLALGIDDEWSGCGLVRNPPGGLPPEPVRYFGGLLVKRAVARKERAQDEGRPVRKLDALLASLAPSGLVPLD